MTTSQHQAGTVLIVGPASGFVDRVQQHLGNDTQLLTGHHAVADIIVLMAPDLDVVTEIRRGHPNAYVLALPETTIHPSEAAALLDAGADRVEPTRSPVLLAGHIRALLRRYHFDTDP